MGGLNSKQISDIKKGKTDVLVITSQRKETLQKKLYTLTSTKTWNLSNNFLSCLSPKISSLTLTTLDLSSNDFLSFPLEICEVSTLTSLDLSYNFIPEIPAEIQHLVALKELNLSFNKINDLHEIGVLTTLQVLKASNNYISKIPDSLAKLQNIHLLSLSHNNISSLPKYTWPALKSLHISSNNLSQIPYSFLCQPKLQGISLSRNKIHSFPPSVQHSGLTSNLREIHINNNHLSELNTNIYLFPKLEILDVKSNELREVPFELFVHCPLIHTLDLSFNPGCKWGMHMPNTFAPPPLIRDIHLSKRQCAEIGRNLIGENVNSDSENTDGECSSSTNGRGLVIPAPSQRTSHTRSPSSSPSASPSSSPSSSPTIGRRSRSPPEHQPTTTTTTTIATSTARMTTTIITADATDTQTSTPKTRPSTGRGPDEQKSVLKRKISNRHVKKYVQNKKQFRLVEHDHSVWDQGVTSHASHLNELMVWSGHPCDNVEEEIKKHLLQMTQIRPGLFLSSKYSAQDRETLHANNITHILVVGAELHPAFPSEFEYYSISVRDNAILDDLSIYFPICQKFIEAGRKKGGVLVHCAAGSSRSASCVMAYLMWKENLSFNDARKELKALRPIVKTNFYLQLEFYENILRGQTKRKPKVPESEKPKMVRSTSLPTIDALHAFKIEKTLDNESELEGEGESNPCESPRRAGGLPNHQSSPHLRNLNVGIPASGADPPPASLTPPSPSSPTSAQTGRRMSFRSLYTDLRVSMPKSDSQSSLDTIREDNEPKKGEREGKQEQDPEVEEVGEGVPNTVIRQASDFEDLSELHSLMRVHSLPELVASGDHVTIQRKLSKGKSFLKHSKINLVLDVEAV